MEIRHQINAYLVTGLLLLVSVTYYLINPYYIYLVVYIWFGFAYGMMLQYGRFCMASASRDLFAAGVPRMAVGILIALVFFSIVSTFLAATNMSTFHPGPIGVHEIVGGIIFGVGMVLAGGCASGSLYKIGEGNGTSALAILGISFGQAIFVDFSWFDVYFRQIVQNPKITLAKTELITSISAGSFKFFLGNSLINTIIPSVLIVILIYYGYVRKGFLKKRKKAKKSMGFTADLTGILKMITASKKTSLMGVLIGVTAGIHIFTMKGMQNRFGIDNFGELLQRMGHTADLSSSGRVFDPGYWYITTQEAQFAGWILEKFGWDMHDNIFFGKINGLPELWRNPALWMSFGIIFGAMVLALLNKEFKLKLPKGELIIWGLGGGLLMGIGARIALGCNIGAFFIRVAGGDPGGWLFGIGMVIGGYGGVKFFNWWTDRKIAMEMENF